VLLVSSVAVADEGDAEAPLTTSVTSGADEADEEEAPEEKASPIKVGLSISTSVGLGSFVAGDQQQIGVATGFSPSITYKLDGGVSLKTAIGGTWYQINDYNTPLKNHGFLFSDLYIQAAHGSVFSDEDLGLTVGASFRVYLPTSLSSQLQNRMLSFRPGLNMNWSFGAVSLSSFVVFAKYFNTDADTSINCETYTNPEECRQGRETDQNANADSLGNQDGGPGVGGGFESEVRGGEVFIPSAGVSSFYAGYGVSLGWTIVEDLNLSFSTAVYHLFGYKSLPKDEFSSQHAKEGRNQTDRLVTSIDLSYQVHKHIGLSLGLGTDTVRPFGSDGTDLVILDFKRAPDNITSLSFGINGSL
jgi:hypothetical protein